jgi:uncharacterized protein (TIGR02679 family)
MSSDELRGEGWTRLLAAARRRLERTGGAIEGSIGLTDPTEAERRVVIGITGGYRPATARRLSVTLEQLDRVLRNRHGAALRETLALLDGPLRDRPAESRAETEARTQVLQTARTHSRHAGEEWYATWLDRMATDGTITRLIRAGSGDLLRQASAVLDRLPADSLPLPVLAEWSTGDTKALVAGSTLARLVLRGLALRAGATFPADRAGQRDLWETAGVIVDDLASQVLVLGVRVAGDEVVARWLNDAADAGIPFRLTLHQQTVAADPITPVAEEIFVCENPAVLRAAAVELRDASAALVCTEGVPSVACHRLLAAAVAAGARVHWRADFDWAGLRITGSAISRYHASPWRMSVPDYLAGLRSGDTVPLVGASAGSPWDPDLAAALAREGRAVMEERLLMDLLADISR